MTKRDELLAELRQLFEQRGELELKLAKAEGKRATAAFDCKSLASLAGKLAPKIRECEAEIITGLTGLPIFDAAAKRLAERAEETKLAASETIAGNGKLKLGEIETIAAIEGTEKPSAQKGKKAAAALAVPFISDQSIKASAFVRTIDAPTKRADGCWAWDIMNLKGAITLVTENCLDSHSSRDIDRVILCDDCGSIRHRAAAKCHRCGSSKFILAGEYLEDLLAFDPDEVRTNPGADAALAEIAAEEEPKPKKGRGKKAEATLVYVASGDRVLLDNRTMQPEGPNWKAPELFDAAKAMFGSERPNFAQLGGLVICDNCDTMRFAKGRPDCPECGSETSRQYGSAMIDAQRAAIGPPIPAARRDDFQKPPAAEPKRGRGRPPGARNKPKEAMASPPA